MDPRPRFSLEVAAAGLLALCCVLTALVAVCDVRLLAVLLPLLALIALALWLGARRLRKGIAAYVSAAPFEGSGLQASLAQLELPAALLSGKTLVWYLSLIHISEPTRRS